MPYLVYFHSFFFLEKINGILREMRRRDECDMDLDPSSDIGEYPWNRGDDFALTDEQNAENE